MAGRGETRRDRRSDERPADELQALTRRQRNCLIGILVVAACARVFWAFYANRGAPASAVLSGDSYSYWYYGNELADGDGYVSYVTGEPTAYYPIGYPAFLAGLFWFVANTPIPDNLPLVTNLVHAAMGTLSVALVFVIGRALFGARVGLVAAGVVAVWPNLVFYVSAFMVETTFILLVLAAVAVLATHRWSTGPPGPARLAAFGTVLGVSALVRPFSLLFLLGLVVALLVTDGWRRALVGLGWTVMPIAVLLTPWTVRNIVVMDSPVVFSTNMGDTLCLDRSLDATGAFRFASHDGCVSPDKPEVARNSGNTRKAIRFVVEHPERELVQIFKRAWYMGKSDHDGLGEAENKTEGRFLGDRVRTALTYTADGYYYAVLPLAVVGFVAFFRGRRPARLFVGIAGLALLLVPLGLWGNPRFHLPALPFLGLAAAVSLAYLWSRRPAAQRGDHAHSAG